MYRELIKTQEEAVSHLFIHCCYGNGRFTDEELDAISEKLVALKLHKDLNFKDEVKKYTSYTGNLGNEADYIGYLVSLIMPVNELALFSYCAELCISDSVIDITEEQLLLNLGNALAIKAEDQAVIQKLAVQRYLVFTQKYF
ncbi:hypothetical protein HNQ91_005808 [Filimonas zeae]|uniref:Tellurite resistance protein TerB n=1 Tax=Filimonas zeae TaxID=1737353 RepID=A0A917J3N8_9BACT|nr:hypothetical protein [Filimonas zeae]MDR6342723.1 hypothetical protein [Filimonas zeae]GGH82450.1 hypothetical protein GCM10011379_56360 [Filimonas zeae]